MFVREVPKNLSGRQRAEFSVIVSNPSNPNLISKTNVKVDLNFGIKTTNPVVTTMEAFTLAKIGEEVSFFYFCI